MGVSAIVLLNSKVDAYNPNVVRTSLGALFSVPVIECANEEFLNYCNKHKVRTVAASPFLRVIIILMQILEGLFVVS